MMRRTFLFHWMIVKVLVIILLVTLNDAIDRIFQRHTIGLQYASSGWSMDCAMLCLRTESCTSYLYNDVAKICNMRPSIMSDSFVSLYESQGWRYYIPKDDPTVQSTAEVTSDITSTVSSTATSTTTPVAVSHAALTCPTQHYLTSVSKCMTFHGVGNGLSYTDMQNYCHAEGGELLRVENSIEKLDLDNYLTYIAEVRDTDLRIMIQGQEERPSGIWRFDNGTEMPYLPWSSLQPNNPNHNCIAVRVDDYLWNDVECSAHVAYDTAFMCETQPN